MKKEYLIILLFVSHFVGILIGILSEKIIKERTPISHKHEWSNWVNIEESPFIHSEYRQYSECIKCEIRKSRRY